MRGRWRRTAGTSRRDDGEPRSANSAVTMCGLYRGVGVRVNGLARQCPLPFGACPERNVRAAVRRTRVLRSPTPPQPATPLQPPFPKTNPSLHRSAFTNACTKSNNPFSYPSQKRTPPFTVLRSPTPAEQATTPSATLPKNEPLPASFCVHQRLHKKQQPLQPPTPKTNPSLHRSPFCVGRLPSLSLAARMRP